MNTRWLLIGFLLPSLFLLLLSCSPEKKQQPDRSESANTLTIGSYTSLEVLHPLLTHGTVSALLLDVIFDGLIKKNEDFSPQPKIALRWEGSNAGKEWKFFLRKGVRFHDGKELTSKDVKFTYDLIKGYKNGHWSKIFQVIDRVIINDRYTVTFLLKKPSISFPSYLYLGILPQHLLSNNQELHKDFSTRPVGTGSYRVTRWSRKEIILERNTDYFLGEPKIATICVKSYSDQQAMWIKLMTGEVDLVHDIQNQYALFSKNKTFTLYSTPGPYYFLIVLNLNDPLFSKKEVRKALNLAIDRKRLIADVFDGRGTPASGSIFPGSLFYNHDLPPYPYNPDEAVRLLRSEGWREEKKGGVLKKNGRKFEIELLVNKEDRMGYRTALHIANDLFIIGIEVQVRYVSSGQLTTDTLNKQFAASLFAVNAKLGMESSYTFLHSSQIAEGLNFFSYKNLLIDRLLEQARITTDYNQRKKISFKFQEELYNDPPGIFLYWKDLTIAVHKRIKGVKINAGELFENIYRWSIEKEQ